ncbi:MAG: hypothetical protein JW910_09365, partial [Anaerolineae bacterium]|nr:hypothetical protein [Anaerolineae bacterium]
GVYYGRVSVRGGTFASNTYDLRQSVVTGWGASLDSTVQVYEYALMGDFQSHVWDIGGVTSAIKAWMPGGRVIGPDAAVYPAGRTSSVRFECEMSTDAISRETPVWLDIPVALRANQKYIFKLWLRRDTATMDALPRGQIVAPYIESYQGGSSLTVLASAVMTAAVDTWEELTLTYTPTADVQGALRITGRHGSGMFWAAWGLPTVDYGPVDAITISIVDDAITAEVTD